MENLEKQIYHTHTDGTHSHDGGEDRTMQPQSLAEIKRLLEYMIQHNEHHAEELAELMEQLPPSVKKRMSLAIGSFEVANVQLQTVLDDL